MSTPTPIHAVVVDIHCVFNQSGLIVALPNRRAIMKHIFFASLILTGLLPMTLSAAEIMPMPQTLNISATAEVRAVPDTAMISAGVVTQNPTAKAAMQANATRMSAVMDAIKAAGIDAKDIQTTGINLQPQYRYAENQPPVVTSYQASNNVNVRIRKIDGVGPVMDALVAKGANQINGPTFTLANEEAALDQARKEAVARARKRAELYADAAGLRVKRILSISEGSSIAPPMPMMRAMAMESKQAMADTPVAPGETSLSVTVNMMFELGEGVK
jgi:uncharacterized protein